MKSFDSPGTPVLVPSAWVMRFAPAITPGGVVLDLAAGDGRHTRYLAGQGFTVTAADIDVSRLVDLEPTAAIEVREYDLESAAWPFERSSFDGIVMTNYLHRPLLAQLADALRPGGALIIETFGAGNERYGRPRNPAFLLKPGELLDVYAGSLQIVAYEHGLETLPRPAVRQRLCAINGDRFAPLS